MRKLTQFTIVALLLTVANTASADSDSILSFGIGTSFAVNQVTPLNSEPVTAFSNEIGIKSRFLHVLAVEFAYSPTDRVDTEEQLVFNSTYRFSGLLYIVPTYPVGLYLKGGVGAGDISELFDLEAATTSYHAGAGLDFHIGDHFVVGAEFLLLLPGVQSIRSTMSEYANEELSRYQNRSVDTPYEGPEHDLGVEDFISANNFRVAVNARYFF